MSVRKHNRVGGLRLYSVLARLCWRLGESLHYLLELNEWLCPRELHSLWGHCASEDAYI